MNFAKLRKIVAIVSILPLFTGLIYVYQRAQVSKVYAVDSMTVTYNGDTPPTPVFSVTNMLPGDSDEKDFKVKNNLDTGSFDVTLRGNKTFEDKEFADILEIIISEVGGSDLYGGVLGFKTVQNFLDEPFLALGNFPAGAEKTFKVKVFFPSSAGNEYQMASVVFDLVWETALPSEVPPECRELAGKITNLVEGTDGNDKLHGSVASDLILAKAGNDKVDSSSNDDCVVLGDGNDRVDSESGNDIILGGNGNDIIRSGSGDDKVYGGNGNDNITLGSGDDSAWGEEGNDVIDGGSGVDYLHGAAGTDKLDGASNTDTCIQGESLKACEILF